jgi:hypothetical protein
MVGALAVATLAGPPILAGEETLAAAAPRPAG